MSKRFKKVYIEISNVCNLQCEFCPEVIREKKFMDRALFAKILTELAPLTEQVCFHLMGEPLVHPDFGFFIETCALKNVPVNLTSNGVLLNEARRQYLLQPIVRQINFSLHSFEANGPGRDISSYLEKIFNFTNEALEKRPDMYVNFRLWNLVPDREPSSTTKMIFERLHQRFGFVLKQVDVKWKKGIRVAGRLYIHFDSLFQWPHPGQPFRARQGFCYGLSSHIGILADGRVVPCCLDKEGVLELGNCSDQNIEAVVNGPRATNIYEGFRRFELVEDLCQKCTFISRFDGKNSSKGSVNPSDVVVAAQLT